MSIEIQEFVDANISISPTGVQLGNFGILGFLTSEAGIPKEERSRSYGSIKEVIGDWATSSEVYKAARAFYGQTPSPKDFVVISAYTLGTQAKLIGNNKDLFPVLVAITDTTLDVNINSVASQITGIDLTAVADFADAADHLTAKALAAGVDLAVTFDGTNFTARTVSSGALVLLPLTGAIAVAMGLDTSATVVDGVAVESPIDALAGALDSNTDFTALALHKEFRDGQALAAGYNVTDIADFCEAAKKIFMNTTNDLNVLSVASLTDVATELKNKALRFTHTSYSANPNQYGSCSVFGRAASVNFEGINTTITLNLKQMPTIASENLLTSELKVLRSKNVNAVVQIGKQAVAFTESRMANGSWLDSVHGLLWLENRIEVDMFNLLYTTNTKIPYTQLGIDMIIAVVERSLEQGVRNGLIASGFLPDGTYLDNGYDVQSIDLGDVSTADKTNRIYRGIKFRAIGAGAIHKVLIDGSFSE